MKNIVLIALVAGVIAFVFWTQRPDPVAATATGTAPTSIATGEMVAVTMPELSADATRGQGYFKAVCAQCHGPNAGGLEGNGPPLIHKIYEPSHHGDMAITMAARRGVQSHHWRFGNMPPVEGITDAELSGIILFIRSVQRANGIS